jgi:alkaline phosphatase D
MINGIASGDVTDNSAIIWARTNREAQMHVQYTNNSVFSRSDLQVSIPVNDSTDFVGHTKLGGLDSDTIYHYRVWFSAQNSSDGSIKSKSLEGNFVTAPSNSTSKSLRFVIGGDLGGSMYCRRPDIGYSIFSVMKALSPRFFLFNGDQIYADYTCPEKVQQQPSGLKLPRFPGWTNIPGDFADVKDSA